ncbi:GNAT family N-acetyltransferase [Sandarakinorhabdus rubra]|uniref:GNAT family N-acetyltransferase n=1 Tax=Sandarakinorhabdus rubra TaxID=2672568 RepID=UPI0013DCAF65|nr:GNAT family N-acetyltransferase [Sandarakinorhabdus rubra]
MPEDSAGDPAIRIRQLTAADVDAYRALRLAGLAAHPHAFGADAEEEAAWPMADWLARLEHRTTFGAFTNDALVGTAALAIEPGRKHAHCGHLVGMYVAPEARGTGAGRALIEAVLDLARGRVELVRLSVAIANAPAIALYLACGFRPYAVDPDAIRVEGVIVDDILMERRP